MNMSMGCRPRLTEFFVSVTSCLGHISETTGPIIVIQKTFWCFEDIDIYWLGRMTLGPKQEAHEGSKGS